MMLPDQLSAARQFQAQLELFRTLTTQAFANAEQLIALNLDATRASFEQSSAAVKQLMMVRDPRDLLAFGAQTEQQFQYMMNYGRELFSIASGARMRLPPPARPPQLALATPVPAAFTAAAAGAEPAAASLSARTTAVVEQAAAAAVEPAIAEPPASANAAAPAVTPPPAAAAAVAPAAAPRESAAAPAAGYAAGAGTAPPATTVAGASRPSRRIVVTAPTEPEAEPVAKETPIANAVSKIVATPAVPSHPQASPLPAADGEVEIAPLKPIEAAPPPAPVSGTPVIDAKAERATPKGNRRKTER